jgi:hypothetical protein
LFAVDKIIGTDLYIMTVSLPRHNSALIKNGIQLDPVNVHETLVKCAVVRVIAEDIHAAIAVVK